MTSWTQDCTCSIDKEAKINTSSTDCGKKEDDKGIIIKKRPRMSLEAAPKDPTGHYRI